MLQAAILQPRGYPGQGSREGLQVRGEAAIASSFAGLLNRHCGAQTPLAESAEHRMRHAMHLLQPETAIVGYV
jgi:hypothetical protein